LVLDAGIELDFIHTGRQTALEGWGAGVVQRIPVDATTVTLGRSTGEFSKCAGWYLQAGSGGHRSVP